MVSTRRSRKSTEPAVEAVDTPNTKESTPSSAKEETLSPTPSKRSSRKKKQSEGLKSKNTGVGLSISIDDQSSAKKNKKIVFDDDDEEQGDTQQKKLEQPTKDIHALEVEEDDEPETMGNDNAEEKEDENDDAVEEVKGSKAREEILHQIEAEEKGAVKTKTKRKRKERVKEAKDEKDDDDDDDLDDDFFAKLETVKAEENRKKAETKKKKKKGKHTTFVFDEHDQAKSGKAAPKKVGHDIQVVVLPDQESTALFDDDAIAAVPTDAALSKEALLYSRSQLDDGCDAPGKRKRNAPVRPDTSWKRSRKMNLLATPKSRFNRRGGKGCPAANFATSSKSKR